MPNWPLVHRKLGRKNVTLDLLWNEYKPQEPEGSGYSYSYSWFLQALRALGGVVTGDASSDSRARREAVHRLLG